MKATFSEFSFGYALTEEISDLFELYLNSAPIFPSQIEEGREGGGYDVEFEFGFPLFLQFKLSEHMIRSNASEWELFKDEYYRFKIWASRHSSQHELLIELRDDYNFVFYAAPAFHNSAQLNNAYFDRQVIDRCAFVDPQEIGQFDDDESHCVVFDQDFNDAYACSKPEKIRLLAGGEQLIENVGARVLELEPVRISEETFLEMRTNLFEKMRDIKLPSVEESRLVEMSYARQVAYIARMFYQCELIFLPTSENT